MLRECPPELRRTRYLAAPLPSATLDEEWADAGRLAGARLAADAEGADPEPELVDALLVVLALFAVDRGGDPTDGTPLQRDPADAVGKVRARRPRRRSAFA